ncbi:hypothetical protein FAX13_09255 [Ligilactobacillus animalis]|nr:hypothetical protein FAX13_09255 [Ligilactobacillus animalis]
MDLEKFQDKIQREMSWRKKELSSIKFDIECSQNNKNSDIQEYRLKAGIVILYSHWEGAIKHFSECYLEYVSDLKLPYKELKPNFLSLSLKKEFKSFSESNKATLHNKLVRKVFSKQEEKSSIPKKDIINAKGNLNSDVFKEIMATIGLSTEEYESRYKYNI